MFRGLASSFDPFAGEPPTWILLIAVVSFTFVGVLYLIAARRWANRRRRGVEPPPKTLWSGSYTPCLTTQRTAISSASSFWALRSWRSEG